MSNNLVVLEGIDNTGKTSTSQKLVEHLIQMGQPASFVKTPFPRFEKVSNEINLEAGRQSHFFYHLSMVKYAEETIAAKLDDQHMICDRYFYSTFAYHAEVLEGFNITLQDVIGIQPDLFILLTADESARMRRGHSKENPTEHDLQSKSENTMFTAVEDRLLAYNPTVIDNTNKSLEEVVSEISSRMEF